MPELLPTSRFTRLLCVLGTTALAAGAAPSLASACTVASGKTTKAFSRFSDQADYQLLPNGAFFQGSFGWTVSGGRVVATGAGLFSGDARALQLAPGGTAISPAFCVGVATPTVRFMVDGPSQAGPLMEYVLWRDWSGASHSTYIGYAEGSGAWQPTSSVPVSDLPLWEAGETLTMRLELAAPTAGGSWSVDDFFLDPFTRD